MKESEITAPLPPQWPDDLTQTIRSSLLESGRTIVVLDDDPTGTQTVYDVPVLTRYDQASLIKEFNEGPPILFLLTNSRAMTRDQTRKLHDQLAADINAAATLANRSVEVISRSDSTLRGHYPLETDTLMQHLPTDLVLVMPFFLEGGRLTINGQHYVREGDDLVFAHDTPFANDAVFGFSNSFMPKWVEEKTDGQIRSDDVVLILLDTIRKQGPTGVAKIFESAPTGSVCIADSVTDCDAQVVAAAVGMVTRSIMARVAASYVRARGGLESKPLLTSDELKAEGTGGLVVVGSHVPKTSTQLAVLLEQHPDSVAVELPVNDVLKSRQTTISSVIAQVTAGLAADKDVVLSTSRELTTGSDAADNLRISKLVSSALVSVVQQLSVRPRYLVAKGGITSSDVATEGLGIERAMVAGSILPGVPVWRLGPEAKFPEMHYVIFPGNVGGDDALALAVEKLK
ncbi:MAG: four-carbon acid sugar kinase family protein [Mariniblastus sp.]